MAAKKKANGHDPNTSRMVELLERIDGRLRETNERLDDLANKVADTNRRLDDLANKVADTNRRLDDLTNKVADTNERIDDLRERTAHEYREIKAELVGVRGEVHAIRVEVEQGRAADRAATEARFQRIESVLFKAAS
jgi:chromosome segregation ATPase